MSIDVKYVIVETCGHWYTTIRFELLDSSHTKTNHQSNMSAHPVLLLVDDDVELADMLRRYFEREGYVLMHATHASQAITKWRDCRAELLILDLMLPDGSGLDLCRELRRIDASVPILMLTARGDPVDRVVGLELGADDYMAKPFDARELLARVRALLRRIRAEHSTEAKLSIGDLCVDFVAARVTAYDRVIALTSIEFRLLAALARAAGTALDRDTLSAAAQPGNYRPLERAVDVQIARLRKKLRDALGADCIVTVRGEGYALVATPVRAQ
jgi:DNA-binding response OmpR family regulator